MINHTLKLDYALAPGWLEPWVEALTAGTALARTCSECGRVSFIPLKTCPCGSGTGTWTALPGTATIEKRTDGTDGSFALVTFDGADTSTVVMLDNIPDGAKRGRIAAAGSAKPALILRPVDEEDAA